MPGGALAAGISAYCRHEYRPRSAGYTRAQAAGCVCSEVDRTLEERRLTLRPTLAIGWYSRQSTNWWPWWFTTF